MSKETEKIIVDQEDIDLSRASFAESLSSTDFDEQSQSFYVTFDKILFKRLHEIVQTVLEVNGYVINLENLLACFDNFIFGSRIKLSSRELNNPHPSPKHHLPCIQFNLPSKSKVGPILKLFYKEIETYEGELARLRGDSPNKEPKSKSPDELQKQIQELKATIKQLEGENRHLKQNLNALSRSHASAEKAIASQNILPPNLRVAKIRDISLEDRIVHLKSGRANFNLPFTKLSMIPNIGDACLVHIDNGQVRGAYFYESEGTPLKPSIGHVLSADQDFCKIRDINRNIWALQSKNDSEKILFSSLRRGMKVIIFQLNQQIIKLERAEESLENRFSNRVNDRLTSFQLITSASNNADSNSLETVVIDEDES